MADTAVAILPIHPDVIDRAATNSGMYSSSRWRANCGVSYGWRGLLPVFSLGEPAFLPLPDCNFELLATEAESA
jgi:hypothetical protein